ncbi:MAG: TrkA C-terminal domain-containing protein, partial [Tannerellaceae bacterium]
HYDVFFATLIVGIFTYYITELIGVVPMNKKLYDFMINENASKYPPRTTMDLQVNSNSYLEGKDHNTLKLPNGCVVLEVYRNNEKIDFNSNITLEKNDQIVLELDSADLEKLHLPLVSMSLDNS